MKGRGVALTALVALAAAVGVAAWRGGFSALDRQAGLAAWSDAFFTVGVFIGGAGLLAFVSSNGLFDIIRYGVGKVLRLGLSRERRDAYPRTFYDYRLLRQGTGASGLTPTLVGLGCVALGGLFLCLYMTA